MKTIYYMSLLIIIVCLLNRIDCHLRAPVAKANPSFKPTIADELIAEDKLDPNVNRRKPYVDYNNPKVTLNDLIQKVRRVKGLKVNYDFE